MAARVKANFDSFCKGLPPTYATNIIMMFHVRQSDVYSVFDAPNYYGLGHFQVDNCDSVVCRHGQSVLKKVIYKST